jgi:hypothetical protein
MQDVDLRGILHEVDALPIFMAVVFFRHHLDRVVQPQGQGLQVAECVGVVAGATGLHDVLVRCVALPMSRGNGAR